MALSEEKAEAFISLPPTHSISIKQWLLIAIIFLLIAVMCFVVIPVMVVKIHSGVIYNEGTASIASTIGGIAGPLVALVAVAFASLAFVLQYKSNELQNQTFQLQQKANKSQAKALKLQQKANEQQNLNFQIQQFENSFFELLRLHKEIVETVEINGNKGKLAFKEPNIAIRTAYDIIKNVAEKIQEENYKEGKEPKVFCREERDDYAFKLVFFGWQTNEFFSSLYDLSIYSTPNIVYVYEGTLFDSIQIPYEEKLLDLFVKERKQPTVPIEFRRGIRIYLNTYFDHLHQTISFVHKSDFLTPVQKKFYVEIITNQLSPDEQVTLFYLSISSVGKEWKELIEHYNLIKNIPFIPDFEYRSHPNWDRWYPNIKYLNPPHYPPKAENFHNGEEDEIPGLYC